MHEMEESKTWDDRVCSVFLPVALCSCLTAQNRFTICGYVRDGETGEELPGATISALRTSAGLLPMNMVFIP